MRLALGMIDINRINLAYKKIEGENYFRVNKLGLVKTGIFLKEEKTGKYVINADKIFRWYDRLSVQDRVDLLKKSFWDKVFLRDAIIFKAYNNVKENSEIKVKQHEV